MSNCICVSNLDNKSVWEKQLTNEEFQTVKGYVKGKSTVAVIPATLKPVRTNNLNNFLKDFFLPTTINHAIKVQEVVGKVFAILAALALDILTFPVRLVTVIPTVIANANQEENLLKSYLIEQGVNGKLLESDHVKVKLSWERKSQDPTSQWTTEDGTVHQRHGQERYWTEQNVNFIELPTYEGADRFSSGVSG